MSNVQYSEHKQKTTNYILKKMGEKGSYQKYVLLSFCCIWLLSGAAMYGSKFIFYIPELECEDTQLVAEDCKKHVCSLPQSQWEKYVSQKISIHAITTSSKLYLCQDQFQVNIAISMKYLGVFVGLVVFSFFSDNYGRKKSIIFSWIIFTFGTILIVLSEELVLGSLAMFLVGVGSASMFMCFHILHEILSTKIRQKYQILIQGFFSAGALLITFFFYIIKNWVIVCLILLVFPSILLLVFIYFNIEQTPYFLLKKDAQKSLRILQKIAKKNKEQPNFTIEEIQSLKSKHQQTNFTFMDLFSFPSTRNLTISFTFVYFSLSFISNRATRQTLPVSIFIESVIEQIPQIFITIFLYFTIHRIRRRRTGLVVGVFVSVILISQLFVNVFFLLYAFSLISKISSTKYLTVLNLYVVQSFPTRLRAMGTSIVYGFGLIAALIMFNFSESIPVFVLCIAVILGAGNLLLLGESKDKESEDEISQILELTQGIQSQGSESINDFLKTEHLLYKGRRIDKKLIRSQ